MHKLTLNKQILQHLEKAIEDLATKKKSQQGLKEAIFDQMKVFKARRNCSENKQITKEICKSLIDEFIMHAKNWVHVKRVKNTAIGYLPSMLCVCVSVSCQSVGPDLEMRHLFSQI